MPSCLQTFLSVVVDMPSTSAASFCSGKDCNSDEQERAAVSHSHAERRGHSVSTRRQRVWEPAGRPVGHKTEAPRCCGGSSEAYRPVRGKGGGRCASGRRGGRWSRLGAAHTRETRRRADHAGGRHARIPMRRARVRWGIRRICGEDRLSPSPRPTVRLCSGALLGHSRPARAQRRRRERRGAPRRARALMRPTLPVRKGRVHGAPRARMTNAPTRACAVVDGQEEQDQSRPGASPRFFFVGVRFYSNFGKRCKGAKIRLVPSSVHKWSFQTDRKLVFAIF